MTARLTSRMLVDGLRRAAQAAGGHVTILAHGDDSAGAILIECTDRGVSGPLLERAIAPGGRYEWVRCGPQDTENRQETADYIGRRRARDPDLWLIELDIAQAERFAAETIGQG